MKSHRTSPARPDAGPETVPVWDIFVRVCHWSVAAAFFVAYFTEDEVLTLHVWAGYTIGVFLVLRLLWGVIGPKHARFGDFVYGPFKVWGYLVDLVAFRAKRYLGHSPAGGAMAVALMLALAATVWSGLELYAVEENAGPLASLSGGPAVAEPAAGLLLRISEDEYEESDEDEEEREELWEEIHELLADLTLALVVLHIGGVLLASLVHRENLARAMVTGRKRAG